MQKNNPVYTLPENFTVMTPEELEVLLQQVDSEKFAILTRLSEARSQIKALQEEEAALALDVKLELIVLDKKAWGFVLAFLAKFNLIVKCMPKPSDSIGQEEIALVLKHLEVFRKHMEACDKQRAILEATLAILKKD